MCCDRLVCANCAGVVADARCSVCRASRAQLHPHSAPLAVWAVLAALLLLAATLSALHIG
jgi:hypothetical protein